MRRPALSAVLLLPLLALHAPPAAAQQAPPPRLDRISLWGTQFGPDGTLTTWLYVQGANLDPAGEVLIGGEVQASIPHQAMENDLLGVDPSTLGYPIHHYRALVVAPGRRPAGSTLDVQLRNPDGGASAVVRYRLPEDAATLDSDGDDIYDAWELRGYDADGDGAVDVDLPALGAHPYRPDVLVEVDVMEGVESKLDAGVYQVVQTAFRSAPILNPQGGNGIHLYVDTAGRVPFSPYLGLYVPENPEAKVVSFARLKRDHFNAAVRGRLFHYCIWARELAEGGSGISDAHVDLVSRDIDGPGDDCIVALESFGKHVNTVRNRAATFMHELGHNLQQRHGGGTPYENNPSYNSVMSYSWQLRPHIGYYQRRRHPVCAPFAYGRGDAVEDGGNLPRGGVGDYIDYSEGMGRELAEGELNELEGVCNGLAVDWNGDGRIRPVVARDINGDQDTSDRWSDFPDWFSLVFSGPRQNGMIADPPARPDAAAGAAGAPALPAAPPASPVPGEPR